MIELVLFSISGGMVLTFCVTDLLHFENNLSLGVVYLLATVLLFAAGFFARRSRLMQKQNENEQFAQQMNLLKELCESQDSILQALRSIEDNQNNAQSQHAEHFVAFTEQMNAVQRNIDDQTSVINKMQEAFFSQIDTTGRNLCEGITSLSEKIEGLSSQTSQNTKNMQDTIDGFKDLMDTFHSDVLERLPDSNDFFDENKGYIEKISEKIKTISEKIDCKLSTHQSHMQDTTDALDKTSTAMQGVEKQIKDYNTVYKDNLKNVESRIEKLVKLLTSHYQTLVTMGKKKN